MNVLQAFRNMPTSAERPTMTVPDDSPKSEFERLAETQRDTSLLAELWEFICENQKWWMIPILVVFSLLGVLIFLSNTAAAPFIYSLF